MQGEGPSAGRRCAFLRLGGCNLSCRWCDTPYTWDWSGVGDSGVAYAPKDELHPIPWREVLERLLAYGTDLVVVSGGEPLSQQNRLLPLVRALRDHGRDVEIETNGTIAPDTGLVAVGVRFNVSPKLSHSGDPEDRRIVPGALRALAAVPGTAFKFVCRGEEDLDEVASLVDRCGTRPVWIMPEGQTSEATHRHLAQLGDHVVARGWNLTTRLHVAVWGDRRAI
ncbi:7-carboxy-7-deazaguanine synthase QueE [Streptomyces albofaciens JCM 4342]|uniref:7-carboxy-7-deazaguanine synthase QueE n=1 Tax=Streptomyces albofaciens TaxID=66866 RepID=UPI00123A3532|nr:7-carboxy-7-deazaguanine synthase QueE [Streptomyces albofaciens]KAA6212329.1 7-carboxy-7-deazaguanine synthase QueE [Streptomyces albofaciens JCM 4342]